jgi:hypothetical protein
MVKTPRASFAPWTKNKPTQCRKLVSLVSEWIERRHGYERSRMDWGVLVAKRVREEEGAPAKARAG